MMGLVRVLCKVGNDTTRTQPLAVYTRCLLAGTFLCWSQGALESFLLHPKTKGKRKVKTEDDLDEDFKPSYAAKRPSVAVRTGGREEEEHRFLVCRC